MGNIFAGARARMSIDGKKFSFCTNVSGSEEIQYDPVEVLDNVEVEEFEPVGYRATLAASKIWFVNETLKSLGWFPKNGTNPSDHLRNILTTVPFASLIEDTQESKPFMIGEHVKLASYNWNISARALVATDVTFVLKRFRDVSEIS